MEQVYIFDSLSHPCLTKESIKRVDLDYSFEGLQKSMSNSNVKWTCAVGLDSFGGYEHKSFLKECQRYSNLIPIAAFNPEEFTNLSDVEIANKLSELKAEGFYGLKFHPRLSRIKMSIPLVDKVVNISGEVGLPVFLCTYYYSVVNDDIPLYKSMQRLASQNPKTKIILVHGGVVELMKYIELTRSFDNLLLDLSLTMLKYENSSLDMDIKFAFQQFDRRICIGSDHPEFNHKQLSDRFSFFAEGISKEKKTNIAYKNLGSFLGIKDEFFEI